MKYVGRFPVRWEQVADAFQHDGSLRDVVVADATLADWNTLFDIIRERHLACRYFVNGEEQRVPMDAAEALARRSDSDVHMTFAVIGLRLDCHFFAEDELELVLDPESIDEDRLLELLEFMGVLGDRLRKNVSLFYENMRVMPILTYSQSEGAMEHQ